MYTYEKLKENHKMHDKNVVDWKFYGLAYEGGTAFIEDAIKQNPRESKANYNVRKAEGVCFNYSQAIVDLFNFYLTEKPANRELGSLAKDAQWQAFEKDADLYGTDYSGLLKEAQKLASVYGSIGILVSKHHSGVQTRAEELRLGIYPHISLFLLPYILDWKYERDPESGRPRLVFLKLEEEDGTYLVWTLEKWERYQINHEKKEALLIEEGINPLNEIPFIWMPNMKRLKMPYLGISDIKEISKIQASIVRNISCGDEVIKWAGFPMLRKPMRQDDGDDDTEDTVGVTAVQEFDPSFGDGGKPDWMESVVGEPIEAILKWIDRKVDETYRIAHLSGVHGQRRSNNEVASGLALKYEFQQLNAVLLKKSANMTEAELQIIRLWTKWQGMEAQTEITRGQHYSLEELSVSLDSVFKALEKQISKTAAKKLHENVVRMLLPDMTSSDMETIKTEIDIEVERIFKSDAPAEKNASDRQDQAGGTLSS